MNQNKDIEMLAKHLAETINVDIVMRDGAQPCTDGKEIVLPSNLNKGKMIELLAALLHETFHIRYSFGEGCTDYENQIEKDVANVLEDIRIDSKSFEAYPEARPLHKALCKYCVEKSSGFKDLALPHRVLSQLFINGAGYTDLHNDEQAQKVINDLSLNSFASDVKNAQSIKEVNKLAKTLARTLFGALNQNPEKYYGEGQQKTAEGAKQEMHDQQEKLSEQMAEKNQQRYKRQNDVWTEKTAQKKINSQIKATERRLNQLDDEELSLDENDGKAMRNHDRKIERAEKKLAELQDEALASAMKENEALRDIEQLQNEYNDMYEESRNLGRGISDIAARGESSIHKHVAGSRMPSMNGFNTLDKADIIDNAPKFTLPETLDELVRKVFVEHQEEKRIDDEGSRLNARNLPRIYTDQQGLFAHNESEERKTRVAFLIDASGSMKDRMNGQPKCDTAISALDCLASALNRVIETDNLPVEFAVYGFSREQMPLKTFEESFDGYTLREKYKHMVGGGTRLLESMNHVSEIMENYGDNGDNLVIVLTDAEVGYGELRTLANQLKNNSKRIYIGIDARTDITDVAELFGYNIKSNSDTLRVLTDALLNNVKA